MAIVASILGTVPLASSHPTPQTSGDVARLIQRGSEANLVPQGSEANPVPRDSEARLAPRTIRKPDGTRDHKAEYAQKKARNQAKAAGTYVPSTPRYYADAGARDLSTMSPEYMTRGEINYIMNFDRQGQSSSSGSHHSSSHSHH